MSGQDRGSRIGRRVSYMTQGEGGSEAQSARE